MTPKIVGKYRVKCLGSGEDHYFLSTDPRSNRIFPRCRSKPQPPIAVCDPDMRGRRVVSHKSHAT